MIYGPEPIVPPAREGVDSTSPHHDADGTGLCFFTKRLEHGIFLWPSTVDSSGTLILNSAQLSMLFDGVDWRAPSGSGDRQRRDEHCGRLTHRHVDR
jgi:transposase